ncbi:MAG TPA: AarF/ABC1/UbiB kinase family protein [Mycobacteriales bacterium]|nr:AarF/ABC1/UbiB kinase family protein [Mycobacteriales bacterium]
MAGIPRRSITRSAKIASLPLGYAGRKAVGVGKRIGGAPAEAVAEQVRTLTAEQMFRVLGELKGGMMKFGQMLSIYEAALPEEIAKPFRESLTRLQEAAPPLPAAQLHAMLAADLGPGWRQRFREFDDHPVASASIGQVHRAVWEDGRDVAVKVQYPGAAKALHSDLVQIGRVFRLWARTLPGLDVRPLIQELQDRYIEELDYGLEAEHQNAYAEAYAGDPDIAVPTVRAATSHVLVADWVDGTPLATVISSGTREQRDRCGILLLRLWLAGPTRTGLMHADPHPGNFRLLDDGRLGVLDWGASSELPGGIPAVLGRLVRLATDGEVDKLPAGMRAEGFIRPSMEVEPGAIDAFLSPLVDPAREERFRYSRDWLRSRALLVLDPRGPAYAGWRRLNLPPAYLLIHRVVLGGAGVLCQLGAEGPFRAEAMHHLPGFARPDETPADASATQVS